MLSRRDALRLAALAAAGTAGPFAVSPETAAALLDGPLDPGQAPPRGSVYAADVHDPVSFAEALDGIDLPDLLAHQAPEEQAALERAFDALFRAVPELRSAPFDHPIHGAIDAAGALACASWMAGVRAGAAYEHLRLALVGPRRTCPRCHGHGAVWAGSPHRPARDDAGAWADEATCPDCRGAGTVPTPAPTLALAAD